MRNRTYLGTAVLLLTTLVVSCCPTPKPPVTPLEATVSAAEVSRARTALVAWLECEECEEGQLAVVLNYRDLLVPSLAATLREGPGPASRELLRLELERRHAQLVDYQKQHPTVQLSTQAEFVAIYLTSFEAQYRVRAAMALGAIGGPEAVAALELSAKAAQRADVATAITEALTLARQSRALHP